MSCKFRRLICVILGKYLLHKVNCGVGKYLENWIFADYQNQCWPGSKTKTSVIQIRKKTHTLFNLIKILEFFYLIPSYLFAKSE